MDQQVYLKSLQVNQQCLKGTIKADKLQSSLKMVTTHSNSPQKSPQLYLPTLFLGNPECTPDESIFQPS